MSRRSAIPLLLLACGLAGLLFLRNRPRHASDSADSSAAPATVDQTTIPTPPAFARAQADAASTIRQNLKRLLGRRDVRPHEALLTFKDADAYRLFLGRAQKLGLTVLGQLDTLRTVRVRYDALDTLESDLLKNGANYSDLTGNYYLHIPEPPAKTDRAAINQVPLHNDTLAFLGATGDRSTWGRGTTIAVIDSGVASDATFGPGRVQYLNVGLGTLPGDGVEDGHGTAVAALAAGIASDAPGVAPAASVLSIRVTGADGLSDIFTVAQAILAAVNAGAPIINISLGGYQTTALLAAAIDYATTRSAIIVAAAGNDQATQLTWPAADPRVVSVGAVDATGQQVTFSNSGPQLQITAPGYGVQTAWLDGERVYVDGTSASAPLVAGAIAAVMSQSPGLTAAQAWAVVQQTVSDAGVPGADADYGKGILNLDWAMNYTNLAHSDPAISALYYDSATNQMDFILQNRSAQSVSGLRLDVATNGFATPYPIPTLTAGASYVVKVPVDQKTLAANGALNFASELVTPFGLTDAVPANNRRSTRLMAPTP